MTQTMYISMLYLMAAQYLYVYDKKTLGVLVDNIRERTTSNM